jgi:acyl carrier protein
MTNNNKTKYFETIKAFIVAKFGIDAAEIHQDSFFEDDLNLSEVDLSEILLELEEVYKTDLMEEKENIESIEDLLDILTEKLD